jgi:uncharacterized membrane protein YhaH (DUF805 family)
MTMELMIAPLKRYADFDGRSRRSEFWLFWLFRFLVYAALMLTGTVTTTAATVMSGSSTASESPAASAVSTLTILVIILAILAMIVPSLAVAVRRIHDIGQSGWWYLIAFIPLGGLVLLVFYLIEGNEGPNRFGPDPKGRGGDQSMALGSRPASPAT